MNLLAYLAWESLSQVAKIHRTGFRAVLNSHSPPLTGNSVRRAGSNSPPRSGLRSELRRGPGPGSVHSSFVGFESSSPGRGDAREIRFSVTWIFAALHWS